MSISLSPFRQSICSCGGFIYEVEATEDEYKKSGCANYNGCCNQTFCCDKCGTRFSLALEAPEAD